MATQTTVLEVVAKGGQEAVAEFEKIAAATEKFRQQATRAFEDTSKKAKDVPPSLRLVNAASKELKSGADDIVRGLGPVGTLLKALGPTGVVAGVAVAGIGAVGAGILAATKRSIDFASQLKDQADAIGINVERLQELQFAFTKTGARDAIGPALQQLAARLGAIRDGQGGLAKSIAEVNPALVKEAQTIATVDDAFTFAVKSISSAKDELTQARLAAAFFGRDLGAKLLPGLREGVKGIADLSAEARTLGVVLDEQIINRADKAGDTLDVLSLVLSTKLKSAFIDLAPLIGSVADEFIKAGIAAGAFLDKALQLTPQGKLASLKEQIAGVQQQLANFNEPVRVPEQPGVPSFVTRASQVLGQATRDSERDTQVPKLTAQLAKLQAEYDALGKTIAEADKAAADAAAKRRAEIQAELAAMQKLRDAESARKEGESKAAQAAEQAAREHEQALRQLQALEDKAALAPLDAIAKVDEARKQSLRDWQALLDEGRISQEEFARADVALTKEAEAEKADIRAKEAEQALREQQRILEEQQRQVAQQQAELLKPFENTIENIQRGIGDALFQAFQGGTRDAASAADTIRDIFARLAAELAQLFLFRGIFGPLVEGLAGAVGGIGGGATASTSSSGGGSFGTGGVFGSLLQAVAGKLGTSALSAGVNATGLGNQGGFLGSALNLLGIGGSPVAAAGASSLSPLVAAPASFLGPAAGGLVDVGIPGMLGVVNPSTGLVASLVPASSPGITGGTSTAAAAGGFGASIGAAAAAAGIGAAIVGAIVNTTAFVKAGDPARLRGGTLQGGTALAGAIPLVSAIQNFRFGHTGEGVEDLLLPTVFQAIRSITQQGPGKRDFVFESLGKTLDQITRSRFFSPGTEAQNISFRQRQAGRAEIRADEDVDFLVRLIARRLSNRADFGPRGISTDIRTLIEGGLARAAAAGKEPFEVIARIVRQLLTFDQAITQFNRASLVRGGSTDLKAGLTQEQFLERAQVLIRVYGRELPAATDAAAVAAGTLRRELLLTAQGIKREAERESRARAEREGTLITRDEVDRDTITRARTVRANARRGGKAAQADVQGFETGLTAAENAVDALGRRLELLVNPAKAADQAFGGVQVALDHVDETLADPRKWDQLPQTLDEAAQAVDAFGQALTGMFDQLRALTDESSQRKLALSLELAQLRGVTNTASLYNAALAEQQARFLKADSAAAKLAATDKIADLERAKAQAQIDALTARSGLASSVEEQIQGIRFGQAQAQGTPATFGFIERALQEALRSFRTSTGDTQLAAGQRVQALLQQQLELGGSVFGTGSARFGALQDQSLRTLEEIQRVIGKPEDIAADVKAIREALATRLEALGNVQQALIAKQITDLRTELGDRFTPDQIEKALADPTFAQLLVAKEQLDILTALEARLIEVRNAVETSGKSGKGGTTNNTTNTTTTNTTNSNNTVHVDVRVEHEDIRAAALAGVQDGLDRVGIKAKVAA